MIFATIYLSMRNNVKNVTIFVIIPFYATVLRVSPQYRPLVITQS